MPLQRSFLPLLIWTSLVTLTASKALRESCSTNSDCTVNKSICTNGACSCDESNGYIQATHPKNELCIQVFASCSKENSGKVSLDVIYRPGDLTKDVYKSMQIWNSNDPKCFTNKVLPSNPSKKKFQLLNLAVSSSDCNLKVETENQKLVVKVKVLVNVVESIITGDDMVVSVTCMLNPTATVSTAVGVSRDLDVISPEKIKEILYLTLVSDTTPQQTLSVCQLEQGVRLQLSGLVSQTAKGFRVKSCEARPDLGSTSRVTLIRNSCGTDPKGLLGFINEKQGFEQIGGVSAAGFLTLKSPPFKCFSFNKKNSLTITCDVTFCSKANQNWCLKDHCQNPVPLFTRRRRSPVSDSEGVNTTRVVLQYFVGNQQIAKDYETECHNRSHVCPGKDNNIQKSCWNQVNVLAVLTSLCVLLIITVVFVMCLVIRNKSNSHSLQKFQPQEINTKF